MVDENGVTDFRKGVIYGERLERARIIALLKDSTPTSGWLEIPLQELITEIKETTK